MNERNNNQRVFVDLGKKVHVRCLSATSDCLNSRSATNLSLSSIENVTRDHLIFGFQDVQNLSELWFLTRLSRFFSYTRFL